MKFVIIGLGNFGSSLGTSLVAEDHEVIGVDNNAARVELYKDQMTYTIKADTTEEGCISNLPINEADYVMVCIGEDVGASVSTIANIKRYFKTPIIARSISRPHQAILEAMNVQEIIMPEAEYARQLTQRFSLKGSLLVMPLDNRFEIVEIPAPSFTVDKTLAELATPVNHNIVIVTLIRSVEKKSLLGKVQSSKQVMGIVQGNTTVKQGDILVLFGADKDIKKFSTQ